MTEELFEEDFLKCVTGLEAQVLLGSTETHVCLVCYVFLKGSPFVCCYVESSIVSFMLPNSYCSGLVICLEMPVYM